MELYEVLFTVPAREVEVGDLIRFPWLDEDMTEYTEVVQVKTVDLYDDHVTVFGYSETINDSSDWIINDDYEVEVLGG